MSETWIELVYQIKLTDGYSHAPPECWINKNYRSSKPDPPTLEQFQRALRTNQTKGGSRPCHGRASPLLLSLSANTGPQALACWPQLLSTNNKNFFSFSSRSAFGARQLCVCRSYGSISGVGPPRGGWWGSKIDITFLFIATRFHTCSGFSEYGVFECLE